MVEACVKCEVEHTLGVIRSGVVQAQPRRDVATVFSNLARCAAKRTSAKRRKISPRTGCEYWAAVRPELARNWSAALQRRFSSVPLAVSFSDGAIHCISQP